MVERRAVKKTGKIRKILNMRYIPYGKHYIDSDDIKEVMKVLRSDWITQGPKIEEFEEKLTRYCGAKYAVAVSSGTAALHIACLTAGIKKGDEIITSPITFIASANCVLYCGGKPVFSDVQEDTINIDPEKIQENITKRTKAIIPVHFAGYPCDLKEIYKIAKRHRLILIEDAAHALGAEYKGTKVGSCKYSDMTVFSFHPVKHITTGEGGAVTTNDKNLYTRLLNLRNHGIYKSNGLQKQKGPWFYEMGHLGYNYRITDFQCALGISQLKKLDTFLKKRTQIAQGYNRAFERYRDLLKPPIYSNKDKKHAWHLYILRLNLENFKKKRRYIFEKLRSHGLGVQVHYIPVYTHPFYQENGYKNLRCNSAEKYYKECISLPIFPDLKKAEIKYIIEVAGNILNDARK